MCVLNIGQVQDIEQSIINSHSSKLHVIIQFCLNHRSDKIYEGLIYHQKKSVKRLYLSNN